MVEKLLIFILSISNNLIRCSPDILPGTAKYLLLQIFCSASVLLVLFRKMYSFSMPLLYKKSKEGYSRFQLHITIIGLLTMELHLKAFAEKDMNYHSFMI